MTINCYNPGGLVIVRSSTLQDCQLVDEWRVMSKGGSDNGLVVK
ncbi:MAG TPA: hypothetical protein V6D09_05935 [Leptolyngbyaceae cyanobacterium]